MMYFSIQPQQNKVCFFLNKNKNIKVANQYLSNSIFKLLNILDEI